MGKFKLLVLSFFIMATANAEIVLRDGGTDSGDDGGVVLVRCENGKVFEMRSFPGQGCMHVVNNGKNSAYMKVCGQAAARNLACRGK